MHTCLSPCGDLDMSPRGIVDTARAKGLDLIAVCDHNTAENIVAVKNASRMQSGHPHVLSGLEVCTLEEVHVLALFETPEDALKMQALVYDHLPPRSNRPDIFGEQVVANEYDEVEGFNDRLLIGATELELDRVVSFIHQYGGLALAAHVDRESFGLLGQLGFFPPDLDVDGLEISRRCDLEALLNLYPELSSKPIIRSSDAHDPSDIGAVWTEFLLEAPSLKELALALAGDRERKILRISEKN